MIAPETAMDVAELASRIEHEVLRPRMGRMRSTWVIAIGPLKDEKLELVEHDNAAYDRIDGRILTMADMRLPVSMYRPADDEP